MGDSGCAIDVEEVAGAIVVVAELLVSIWLRSCVSGGRADEKMPLNRCEFGSTDWSGFAVKYVC